MVAFRSNRAQSTLLLIGLIALWEGVSRVFGVSPLILPSPSLIVTRLIDLVTSGLIWPHLLATLTAILTGFVLGATSGLLFGGLISLVPVLERLLYPYVVALQTVPKIAIAPLFVVWFGYGITSKVVIAALICFFPLMENTLTALQQVPPERLELFRMLGATRAQTLWRLKVPMGLPAILAGLRVAVVLALVGAVVGEFIGASRGLGALVIASQGTMDTALMFAVLVLIAALGLLVYEAALFVERRLLLPFHRNS